MKLFDPAFPISNSFMIIFFLNYVNKQYITFSSINMQVFFFERIPRSSAPGLPHFLFVVRNSGDTECQEIGVMPCSLLRG